MNEREELEQAIKRLESQRDTLGDTAVDAALAGLQQKMAELARSETGDRGETLEPQRMGERRLMTILFCDVVGSTTLAEGMDPEAWTQIMNTAFTLLIEPIEHYGGTVARLMGDAILAFYGAPTAHEDDPQRAVLAGLAIVRNVQPFREQLQKEKGLALNVRVGINTGLAVVGNVGSEVAAEYTAMGDAVNVAARMEQTARPGTVQIAQDTYTRVAPLFDFESLGPITVKGKRQPISAYRVLGSKAQPGRIRGLTALGISAPLIGRDQEMAAAQGALTRLMDGMGGILALIGEAGIGKSRLLGELREAITNLPLASSGDDSPFSFDYSQLTWLEGQAQAYGQTISYWPFQQILREYVGINERDGDEQAWSKLETGIRGLFPKKNAEVLPYLASLLAIEVRGAHVDRVKYLDGEDLRHQVLRASWLFFQRLAEARPLVLVIDDLHWLDSSSAGLLQHLMPLTQRTPLLICALSRPDPASPAVDLRQKASREYADSYTEIRLAPLSKSDSSRLVHNLLEIDGLPAHVRQMMVDKADGNPYFLEEIVRDLIQAGALVYKASSGRWRVTQLIETVTVPETIQALVIARIDRLDESLKRVVRRAAVIGRSFLFRVLQAVMDDGQDLRSEVKQLERVELIREKQDFPELEYIFKHALAQEAAYDGILLQERRELHVRVGAAIERLMADRLEEFYGLLAYHYSAAEKWEQAQAYLFKAGDQAGRLAADAEALAYYRRAIEAYGRARGNDWEVVERARIERKIGEALFRLGEHDKARAYLERSLALLEEGMPASRWGTRLAILRALLTQASHRFLPRLFLPPIDSSPDPLAEEIFLASLALGWVEAVADIERYLLVAIKALNASERKGFGYGSAYFAAGIGPPLILFGFNRLADAYFRLAADYARQIDRPVYQLEASMAMKFNLLGKPDNWLAHARLGAEIARSSGAWRETGGAMLMICWAYYFQGKLRQAVDTARQMIQIGEEGSDRQVVVWGLTGLGTSQMRLGLMDEAISSLQQAKRVAEAMPDYSGQVTAGSWLGRCYAAIGNLELALSVLEASQAIELAHPGSSSYVYLKNGLSLAYLTAAERSTGQVKQAWLQKAQRAGRKALQAAKRNRPALPDAHLFWGRYQWLRGKPALARKSWARALAQAERIGDPYMEGVIHLEIGQRLGDGDHLQQAESLLEAIDAEFDLAAAREAQAESMETTDKNSRLERRQLGRDG